MNTPIKPAASMVTPADSHVAVLPLGARLTATPAAGRPAGERGDGEAAAKRAAEEARKGGK
jgi:hypothetical protein